MVKSSTTTDRKGVSTRHLLICNWLSDYLTMLEEPKKTWPMYWVERVTYASIAVQSLIEQLQKNPDVDPDEIVQREYSKWDLFSEYNEHTSWMFKCMRAEIDELSQILQSL